MEEEDALQNEPELEAVAEPIVEELVQEVESEKEAPIDPLAHMTIEEKMQHYVELYGFEMCMIVVIVLSIMYFFWGKSRNDRLVFSWLKSVAPVLR